MVVRKDLLLAAEAFDATFPYPIGEVFDLNARLLSAGRLAIIWKPLLMYRSHEGNATSGIFIMDYCKLRTFEFIQERNPGLPDSFKAALMADLPERRSGMIRWAFERGDFAIAKELLGRIPEAERTFAQKCMTYVMRTPAPITRTVSWSAPKFIRNAGWLTRRHQGAA